MLSLTPRTEVLSLLFLIRLRSDCSYAVRLEIFPRTLLGFPNIFPVPFTLEQFEAGKGFHGRAFWRNVIVLAQLHPSGFTRDWAGIPMQQCCGLPWWHAWHMQWWAHEHALRTMPRRQGGRMVQPGDRASGSPPVLLAGLDPVLLFSECLPLEDERFYLGSPISQLYILRPETSSIT